MPRYVLGEKFWAITLEGKQYTTTFGKIGSAGQTRLKTFDPVSEGEPENYRHPAVTE